MPGEQATLELRLKLLADVGLVGLPNAGKSSLLRRLTRAQPKVADYPFTTLEPALGTITDDDAGRQLVLADIPGLIEGAAEGAGLGHEFLAHVERTSLLVHVVDVAPIDGSEPWDAFTTVRGELHRYGAGLEERPFFVVLNKIDLLPAEDVDAAGGGLARAAGRRTAGPGRGRAGRDRRLDGHRRRAGGRARHDLLDGAGARASEAAPEEAAVAEHAVYRPAGDGFERRAHVRHVVPDQRGRRSSGWSERHDLENPDALAYIEERLKAMGVVKQLEARGFEPGDEVEIGDVAFALYPGIPQE